MTRGRYELRGCRGTFAKQQKLKKQLPAFALVSALEDDRFDKVVLREIPSLRVTVSLLTHMKVVPGWRDWVIGRHGISIQFKLQDKWYSATYLPGVMKEQGWGQLETMKSLVRKSGANASFTSVQTLPSFQVETYESSVCKMDWREYNDFIDQYRPPHHLRTDEPKSRSTPNRSRYGTKPSWGSSKRNSPPRNGLQRNGLERSPRNGVQRNGVSKPVSRFTTRNKPQYNGKSAVSNSRAQATHEPRASSDLFATHEPPMRSRAPKRSVIKSIYADNPSPPRHAPIPVSPLSRLSLSLRSPPREKRSAIQSSETVSTRRPYVSRYDLGPYEPAKIDDRRYSKIIPTLRLFT